MTERVCEREREKVRIGARVSIVIVVLFICVIYFLPEVLFKANKCTERIGSVRLFSRYFRNIGENARKYILSAQTKSRLQEVRSTA